MRSKVYILSLFATTFCLPWVGLSPLASSLSMAATPVQSTNETRKAEADRLFKAGHQQLDTKQFDAALQSFQAALKIYQQIGDRLYEGISYTDIGLTYYYLGQYPQSLSYYQQALSIGQNRDIQAVLPKEVQRLLESTSLLGIGKVHSRLGQNSQAIAAFHQVLTIAKETRDRKSEIAALAGLGSSHMNLGQYSHALNYYRQSLKMREEIGDRAGEGIVLNNIGEVYRFQGEYAQALKFYQQALNNRRTIGDRLGESSVLGNIGATYSAQGQYALALESLQQAIKITKELGDRSSEGIILGKIGQTYFYLGQYSQALDSFQQALNIVQDIGDQKSEATALNDIGLVYSRQKRYALALEKFQQSLDITRKIGDRSQEGATLNNIGQIYVAEKQYDRALEISRHVLNIAKQSGARDGEANTLNNIGGIYYSRGQDVQALEFFQEALSIRRAVGNQQGEAIALYNIAALLERKNQPALAIVFYKQSVNVWESIRGELRKLPIVQQQSFTNTVADRYRRLADLLLQQNRVLEAQRVLDLLKVQELEDYLRDVRGNAQTAQGVEYWQPEQRILELYNRAIAQGNELAQLRAIPDAKLTPKQRQRLEQLVAAEGEILQSFDAFTNRPEVTAAVQQLSQTSKNQNVELTQLNSLQNNLQRMKQNVVLLYPLILEDRLELVLVTPNSPPIRRPVNVRREDLNRAISEFLQALKDPTSDATKPAQKLYQWLIQPIEADLKAAKAQTIVYAPDGQLRYVPLAALHDGQQWLTQRFRINYITAASLTDFDDPPQPQMRVLAAAFADSSRQFTVKAGDRSLTFAGLPYAKIEVENLAAIIPGTTELINAAFNRKSTLPRLGSYTVVHFATHAAFLPGQPEDSFILFGDGDRLSLRDLKRLNLPNVDLVVLSACETGVGNQLGNGIEILGFGFQMQRTGARAAIASLWQVNDGGTQVLMNDFYAVLQRGKITKAEALRQAQIALITQTHPTTQKGQTMAPGLRDRLTHPYYWAPFILIGNGL